MQIMALLLWDYCHLCSFMREKIIIKDMILAKCTDMNVPGEIAIVSNIFQLCIQRENHLVMPLWQNEVEKGLQLYALN